VGVRSVTVLRCRLPSVTPEQGRCGDGEDQKLKGKFTAESRWTDAGAAWAGVGGGGWRVRCMLYIYIYIQYVMYVTEF